MEWSALQAELTELYCSVKMIKYGIANENVNKTKNCDTIVVILQQIFNKGIKY